MIAAWLNASQRSRIGVRMNWFARGLKLKADWTLSYIKSYHNHYTYTRTSAMDRAPASVNVLSFMLSTRRLGFWAKASASAVMPTCVIPF